MLRSVASVFVLLLAGCAAQPERIKNTESGYAEGIFKSANAEAIKGHIIDACNRRGYIIAEASSHTVLCQKQEEGMEAVATTLLIGNRYSTPPLKKVRATIYTIGPDVKVTMSMSAETQMAFGQVRSLPLNSNESFNELQRVLLDMGAI